MARPCRERLDEEKGTFGRDDCVHSLDCDDAFKDVYMCWINLLDCTYTLDMSGLLNVNSTSINLEK